MIVSVITIGGVRGFSLGAETSERLEILSSKNGLYSNARSALYALTQVCQLRRIWLPSFICDTVLQPFEKASLVFNFYPVNSTLDADFSEVSIAEGDAVLLISYFGVPIDDSLYEWLKEKGVCVIEDLSQAVYSSPNKCADFSVYSLRKFFAVPDGGIVVSNGEEINWPYTSSADRVDLLRRIEAISDRSLFDAGLSNSKAWVSGVQKSEAALVANLFPMSLFTRAQVAGSIDFENDRTQRIKNFDYWASYSFLDTERDYKNYPTKAQPNFTNTHNLSLVGKYWINDWRSQVGFSYALASGRTYTNPNEPGFLNDKTKPFNSLSLNWAYLISPQLK